jgi:hypothetical protein
VPNAAVNVLKEATELDVKTIRNGVRAKTLHLPSVFID